MVGLRSGLWAAALLAAARAETTTIYKVDYPVRGFCGQEVNVTKSRLNPHWFFPTTFGGFQEGNCSDVGYTWYAKTEEVKMHPLPGVYHTLSFDLYAPTQTKTITMEFLDPERPGRVVKAKFCMPTVLAGTFPLYIFGHGAGCNAEDYQYFCQVAATLMYYQDSRAGAVFPADFDTSGDAMDAAFLARKLPEVARKDWTSPLFQRHDGTVVMGGHSMGGGMTVLSVGRDKAPVNGVALFAPGLYTIPRANPFLQNITVPALVVSGAMDCGPNALEKQARPAFDGLASGSKVLVVLKGANHCGWTQPFEKGIGLCSTFEKNECHGISRAEQHELGARLFEAFASALRGAADGWASLEKVLAAGEAEGSWTYYSSRSSPKSKVLRNNCPCGAQEAEQLVV